MLSPHSIILIRYGRIPNANCPMPRPPTACSVKEFGSAIRQPLAEKCQPGRTGKFECGISLFRSNQNTVKYENHDVKSNSYYLLYILNFFSASTVYSFENRPSPDLRRRKYTTWVQPMVTLLRDISSMAPSPNGSVSISFSSVRFRHIRLYRRDAYQFFSNQS